MTPYTAEAGPSTIPLYLINGVATIWDAQSMSPFPPDYLSSRSTESDTFLTLARHKNEDMYE